MNLQDVRPTEYEVRYSERFKRRAHRRDIRAFFSGAWLLLGSALALADETLEGLRSGECVDIGVRYHPFPVPAWLAATLTAGTLLLSRGCFGRYRALKATAPAVQPGDEEEDEA